jgi:hypothetical protein
MRIQFRSAEIDVLGIRHHGPGSAKAVKEYLEERQPDLILIEGPPDADNMLAFANAQAMEPPLALLVYNPKELSQASFFPFASYSPEWQAIQFALANSIPVRFFDLPMAHQFRMRDGELPLEQHREPDPFVEIAALGAYTDPERWWEALIERGAAQDTVQVFDIIHTLMQALRESKKYPETKETLLREAWMRQEIRKAEKTGAQKIVAVCGAWHAPALTRIEQIKQAEDLALLKGLPKVKTEAGWIPWSYRRLHSGSGYRAGVLAPAWYDVIWEKGMDAASTHWLTLAARLLREEGLETASSHVIEAIRLAETLATLRNTQAPGIEELMESARSVLCQGAEKPLDLLEVQLVVGSQQGVVPDTVPQAPLRSDFEAQVKKCRLKLTASPASLSLDLRTEAGLRKSHLLHRMLLLGIQWGKRMPVSDGKQGGFHEEWTLQWEPEYEIQLIEAGVWGNTVVQAATACARDKIQDSDKLAELAQIMSALLMADLPGLMPGLVRKLHALGSQVSDALLLADAVLPLVEVLRYGSARKLNMDSVAELLDGLIPRVCIQLPAACVGLNEEAAQTVLKQIVGLNRAIGLLDQPVHAERLIQALNDIHANARCAPMLRGLAVRMLFDKKVMPLETAATRFHFALSDNQPAMEQALWLEGFLFGSGLLLLHHPALWNVLNDWVQAVGEDSFVAILPILRRSFGAYSGPERAKMLDLARQSGQKKLSPSNAEPELDAHRTGLIQEVLTSLFGPAGQDD